MLPKCEVHKLNFEVQQWTSPEQGRLRLLLDQQLSLTHHVLLPLAIKAQPRQVFLKWDFSLCWCICCCYNSRDVVLIPSSFLQVKTFRMTPPKEYILFEALPPLTFSHLYPHYLGYFRFLESSFPPGLNNTLCFLSPSETKEPPVSQPLPAESGHPSAPQNYTSYTTSPCPCTIPVPCP